jgi:uncharacterized flavoprotein (TIGR03862 family)
MAAEVLLAGGAAVEVFEAMPSAGRKFLMAGKGGLNLTHSEPAPQFLSRYGPRARQIAQFLDAFDADALREWAHGLGIDTFVGTSGRIFRRMKAAPLLRGWLHRLRAAGMKLHVRHRWQGWNDEGALVFSTPQGERAVHADALILALGGGSWAKLGSDAAWVPLLEKRGVPVACLRPANCGFDIGWSEHLMVCRRAGEDRPHLHDWHAHRHKGELASPKPASRATARSAPLAMRSNARRSNPTWTCCPAIRSNVSPGGFRIRAASASSTHLQASAPWRQGRIVARGANERPDGRPRHRGRRH